MEDNRRWGSRAQIGVTHYRSVAPGDGTRVRIFLSPGRMLPPVNQAPPSAAKDAASASDEPKTTHAFVEHGRNSPAFLARIRRAQRFRRYSCAAFGLSLLTVILAIFFWFAGNPESLSVPLLAAALVVTASSLLMLVAAPFAIIWTTLRIAWQRNRMNEAKGTILLNDIPREAAESAAAPLSSRWAMACVISIIGMLAVSPDYQTAPIGFWRWLMSFVLFVAAIVSAALSVKHGRQVNLEERRRRSKIVETHDLHEREFVLYLRSFTDDVAGSRLGGGGLSMEEQFVRTVNQIAPVATIGLPGETQPHAGAFRLYVDNTSWQQSVEQLLEKAKLVIIRTGLSGGLHWEIERVARSISPQRVLIVVDDKVEMLRCLECLRNVHSQVSPSVGLGWRRVCGIRGLLVFDEQWRVSKLRLRGRGIYAPRSRNFIEPGLARSLYPLFQTLGVEWPRPLIDWSWPVTTLMPSLFVLLVLGALLLRGLELVGLYTF